MGRLTTNKGSKGGVWHTPEYACWSAMWQRCTDKGAASWHRYGGRGITVCAEWNTFAQFLADVGTRPGKEYSIERVDNAKGYQPDNARWATQKEQCRNRRSNMYITYQGKTQLIVDWAAETGIAQNVIGGRLRLGWDVERIFAQPVAHRIRPKGAVGNRKRVGHK